MHYRHEIDGLRAVAVVPVIFFHAGFDAFSGGFVGVDIFFVISGYLITTILINDLDAGRFSLARFYERRARRILPALFFVMLCCLPFAWLWMTPPQLKDFSQSLVAVSTFVSNVLFWRESGYFDAASELKPLLHTWSLAVEEQFYIFFPILLLGLWRFARRRVFPVIIVLCVVSLLVSHWGSVAYPAATFYLIPTRAWELGAGSICAFLLKDRAPYNSTLVSGLGLLLILGSIFLYDVGTPFPSLWALAPVGGTALVILFAQGTTLTAKALSLRPFVFIGLISFSAYLWHQPLFAFARIRSMAEPSELTIFTLVLLSFGLAVLSWRYVEQPFRARKRPFPASQFRVFAVSGSAMALIAAVGVMGHLSDGAPFRRAPNGVTWQDLDLDERLAVNPGLGLGCVRNTSLRDVLADPDCRTGETPRMLLWGDSYAMHLAGALRASALSEDRDFIQLTKSQCAPILDRGVNDTVTTARDCIDFNDRVMAYLEDAAEIEFVIMSSPYSLRGKATFDRAGQRRDDTDAGYSTAQMIVTAEKIVSLGKVPVFVTPPPGNGTDIGKCLGTALARQRPLAVCNYHRKEITAERRHAFATLDGLGGRYTVIDLRKTLCSGEMCLAAAGDVFLFRDTGHLSVEGTRHIGREMDPFRGMVSAPEAGDGGVGKVAK